MSLIAICHPDGDWVLFRSNLLQKFQPDGLGKSYLSLISFSHTQKKDKIESNLQTSQGK